MLGASPAAAAIAAPRISIRWDSRQLGVTGREVTEILDTTEPRIVLGGVCGGVGAGQDGAGDTGISLTAFMMSPGDEKIVAERVHQVLSAPRTPRPVEAPRPPSGNLTGHWKVDIQFGASRSTQTLDLVQDDGRLQGTRQGDFRARELTGTIEGNSVTFVTRPARSRGDSLTFRFTGTLGGNSMSGELDMGECLSASWTAQRHVSNRSL